MAEPQLKALWRGHEVDGLPRETLLEIIDHLGRELESSRARAKSDRDFLLLLERSHFGRHARFGDCKPNEVYIGSGVFAAFDADGIPNNIRLRDGNGGSMRFDGGGVSILHGAAAEWQSRQRR